MPSNVSLQGIEFSIKGSADEASKSVKQLTQELNELKDALKKSEGIGGLATSLKKFENINTTMLSVAGTILKEISQLDFTNIREAAQGIKDIADAARQVANMGSKDVALEQVIGEPDKLRTALSYVQQFGHALGSTVLVSLKGVGIAAKGIGQVLAFPFKAGISHVKRFAEGLKNVVSSLKRIAFYRIVRSVIKAITQAFQEGLKNAYEFSRATGDQAGLANALDTLATKGQTMKNQLGAAFGGLLTAITPIVVQIIGWVTKLAEALSRLMAILGGSNTYLKAKDVWTEWGEAAAGAGGAAKKALEYLAPFDELNVLPDPKSGGGGGGSANNFGDMFEYADVGEGSGFLESIKGMLDKVSEFFETTDWAGLADSAWQKLKERFSDTGQATAVIRSLFEALGAALGAAASFIAQFVLDVCRDIWSYFKQYIKDDNGDGEITGREIINGIWEGIKNAVKGIGNWIKTNIFDPFITGFKAAFGIHSPAEEMIPYGELITEGILAGIKNAWKNIKSWLLTNLYNPMAEAWNSLVGEDSRFALPIYGEVQEVGMGSTVHVSSSGHLHGGSNGTFSLDMDGNVTNLNDALSVSKKIVNGITAGLTTAKDNIPSSQKNIKSVADVTKWSNDISNTTYPGTKKPYIPATANVNRWANNISNSTYNGGTRPFISSTANVNRWENNISNGVYSGTKRPSIASTANVNRWDNNLSNSVYSGTNKPYISSISNLADYKNNLGTPSIGSEAYIKDYSVASYLKSDGYMEVNANLYIKGQTNTPTVTVSAKYNSMTPMTQALGGAFYGGSWHDIPQYASGGKPHGSLFLAGEAGAELVGHVGGRTEVLNQSQLAATMYSAVKSAMASTGFRISASPNPVYNTADGGGNEDVLYRAFKRALDETDFGGDVELDGQTLYKAMVNRNRQNTRLTGVNAMA